MSEGIRLIEYLSRLPQPLRLPDLLAHIRATDHLLNLQPSVAVRPVVPFPAAPVQHQGVHVGNFFLAKTDLDDDFSHEDEGTLTMFAARRPWRSPTRAGTGTNSTPGTTCQP